MTKDITTPDNSYDTARKKASQKSAQAKLKQTPDSHITASEAHTTAAKEAKKAKLPIKVAVHNNMVAYHKRNAKKVRT